MDAREHLERLVGRVLRTIPRNEPNRIVRLEADRAVVATGGNPVGAPVPIAWVQQAMDRLDAEGEVSMEALGREIGHRSGFLGAVLREVDDTEVLRNPARIRLSRWAYRHSRREEGIGSHAAR
jgi:hypothetical protein